MQRAQAARARDALLETRRRPRKIEVHDHGCVVQIQSFAGEIGGEQEIDALRFVRCGCARGAGRKALERFLAREPAARNSPAAARKRGDTAPAAQLGEHRVHRVRELREDEHLLAGMTRAHIANGLRARGIHVLIGAHACEKGTHRIQMGAHAREEIARSGRGR